MCESQSWLKKTPLRVNNVVEHNISVRSICRIATCELGSAFTRRNVGNLGYMMDISVLSALPMCVGPTCALPMCVGPTCATFETVSDDNLQQYCVRYAFNCDAFNCKWLCVMSLSTQSIRTLLYNYFDSLTSH